MIQNKSGEYFYIDIDKLGVVIQDIKTKHPNLIEMVEVESNYNNEQSSETTTPVSVIKNEKIILNDVGDTKIKLINTCIEVLFYGADNGVEYNEGNQLETKFSFNKEIAINTLLRYDIISKI